MTRHHRPASEQTVTVHQTIERLQECSNLRWIKPDESYESNKRRYGKPYHYDTGRGYVDDPARPWLPVEYSTSYGDWHELSDSTEVTPDTFVIPKYCTGSDYSGNLVEVSNYKAMVELLEGAELEEGIDYLTYSGGYGTFAIAIRAYSLIETTECDSIIDTLESLGDYPLIDESLESELEMESQNEAWESWGKREFAEELGKYLEREITAGLETEGEYAATFGITHCSVALAEFARNEGWAPDDKLGKWFYKLAEYANENWVNEQGSDSYIDMADVVKHGMERELKHWPDGASKRDALACEIRATLVRAYEVRAYDEIARVVGSGGESLGVRS